MKIMQKKPKTFSFSKIYKLNITYSNSFCDEMWHGHVFDRFPQLYSCKLIKMEIWRPVTASKYALLNININLNLSEDKIKLLNLLFYSNTRTLTNFEIKNASCQEQDFTCVE